MPRDGARRGIPLRGRKETPLTPKAVGARADQASRVDREVGEQAGQRQGGVGIMSFRINQNVAAFNAYRNLESTGTSLSKSLEKLSSGFRINRASDDAAG